jgi:hypothetical protein
LAFVGKFLTPDSVKNTHGRHPASCHVYIHIYTIITFIYVRLFE